MRTRAFFLSLVVLIASGCGGALGPAYTEEELAQRCLQTGGWWHADALMGGFCEYEAPGFV